MTEDVPPSATEQARQRRRARRIAKAEMRRAFFWRLAEGFTQESIARSAGVSVATVRREIDRHIAAQRIRTPAQHVHLQIERVNKALVLLDIRLSRGETAAVGPFLKTLAALDKYHGFGAAEAEPEPRAARPALPAPPLALTHAAPALTAPRTVVEAGDGSD